MKLQCCLQIEDCSPIITVETQSQLFNGIGKETYWSIKLVISRWKAFNKLCQPNIEWWIQGDIKMIILTQNYSNSVIMPKKKEKLIKQIRTTLRTKMHLKWDSQTANKTSNRADKNMHNITQWETETEKFKLSS